jgi:hypothetical protein
LFYGLGRSTPLPVNWRLPIGGTIDSLRPKGESRSSALNFETPVRIGDFNWRNALRISDRETEAPRTVIRKIEDPANPGDSLTVTTTYPGDFFTGLDWETGINLPLLFRGSWKLQPTVGITNTVSGQPFLLRHVQTGGDYVTQGKRFALSLSSAPTLFGFYPGFGPVQRIRHSFSPIIAYSWAPRHPSIDFAAASDPWAPSSSPATAWSASAFWRRIWRPSGARARRRRIGARPSSGFSALGSPMVSTSSRRGSLDAPGGRISR